MFPMKTTPDSPAEEMGEPSSCACPYCGKSIQLKKEAPAAPAAPKLGPKPSNAAKMPMDQLKNVIKSGSPA